MRQLQGLGADGRTLKWRLKNMGWEDVEWIHLAQDMKSGRLLWIRWRNFGLRTTRETGWI